MQTGIKTTYTIDTAKTIASMDLYGREPASGFRLHYHDSTTVDIGPIDPAQPKKSTTITGQFVGLRAVFTKHNSGENSGLAGINAIEHNYVILPIPDFTQALGLAYASQTFASTATDPSYGESFTAVLSKGGTSISPFPAWFKLNLDTKTLTVDTLFSSGITLADLGNYVLTITGTLANYVDPATGLPWKNTMTTTLTIINDCTLATSLSGTMPNLEAYIGFTLSQPLPYSDNISDVHANLLYCKKAYAFSVVKPYAIVNGDPKVLNIYTEN